jgi:holo-[acyl-carrier protein] synthase
MRVGCDVVDLMRFQRALADRHFVERVFHPIEIDDCAGRKNKLGAFGGRFAAKEALAKAIGRGLIIGGVFPRDIWIRRGDQGRPQLECASPVAELIAGLGYSRREVSISHDGRYALATVLLF